MGYCPYLSVLKIKEIVTPEQIFSTTGGNPPISGDDPLLAISEVTSEVLQEDLDNDPVTSDYVLTHFNCLETDCHLWDTIENQCSYRVLADVKRHNHDAHSHSLEHECGDRFDVGRGDVHAGAFLGGILMNEWSGNQDLDGNNKIYGKDFVIDENDPNCPEMLKLGAREEFTATTKVSWADYKNGL